MTFPAHALLSAALSEAESRRVHKHLMTKLGWTLKPSQWLVAGC